MLTYHPMHDHSHCAFRILCLAQDISLDVVSWELLQLLDFYLLFPHELKNITLPRNLFKFKAVLKEIPEPYENLTNAKRLFFSLGEIQKNTRNFLSSKGIFVQEAYQNGIIQLRPEVVPRNISALIQTASFKKEFWYDFITKELPNLGFEGAEGLKKRSGLMEFRYDVT